MYKIILLTSFDHHKSKFYSHKYKTNQQLTTKKFKLLKYRVIFPVGSKVSQLKFGLIDDLC